ncbi:uracil-DNA glycosylase [Undibacterium sp.]|uniref:uracil-DNA glycosylase n=1 Tax=Undibacterium sp. TaxID=1914977 RepID=UPI002B587726|nr:uracil-DNA glycosylase [Undibacterium sp.]HTD03545.1 uracil-DNA glycosylase [Undibacterium sp.]
MNNHQGNVKNSPQDRRSRILDEMRLGPVWQLKEAEAQLPAGQAADVAVQLAANSRQEGQAFAMPQSPLQNPVPATLEDAFATLADAGRPDAPASAIAAAELPADVSMDRALQRADAIAEMGWDELEASVSGCRACGLCEGRANTVFGVGDRKAAWLFVGEGPGYNENLQGEPFVGAAGQLLDNMMRGLDMQRGENTFIANVVKCRPTDAQGKDRPPTPQETAACLPYLRRQIELIKPEVIVALGKTAAISLLAIDPETPVAQLRGKLHRYARLPLVVTYHPAYLLRKPIEKSKAWADLCLARNACDTNKAADRA